MLKVDFLSALNNFPLLNFTLVSSREKICFIGWFSVAFTIHCENRKHILKIEKCACNTIEIGKEQRQVQCPKQILNFENK